MYIQITNRCNMACEHCGMSCGPAGEDMSMEVFKAAGQLAQDNGHYISLGGGEPTLHPDFWAFIGLSLAYSEEGYVWLATNGSQTETALKLARMAEKGVIGCALSQDQYHDEIDDRVIEAFASDHRPGLRGNDSREIRCVDGNIVQAGRAAEWGNLEGCVCDDLFVSPDGKLWACGCQSVQFGTVFEPDIPGDWGSDEMWDGYRCPTEYEINKRELEAA